VTARALIRESEAVVSVQRSVRQFVATCELYRSANHPTDRIVSQQVLRGRVDQVARSACG
jgi:hypothetical protein